MLRRTWSREKSNGVVAPTACLRAQRTQHPYYPALARASLPHVPGIGQTPGSEERMLDGRARASFRACSGVSRMTLTAGP
jgi:hypothetical protein